MIDEVHRAGGLYVADEVQSGFGRIGAGLWGFQRHGIGPDIVTIGKPMGNGLPIAAAVSTGPLVDFGRRVRYFNTFGGNTVSIAAAQAVLDVIRDEGLIENAAQVGARSRRASRRLTSGLGGVAQVRGDGPVRRRRDGRPAPGTDPIPTPRAARQRVASAPGADLGVGPTRQLLKIRPPMAFRSADADRLVDALRQALETV